MPAEVTRLDDLAEAELPLALARLHHRTTPDDVVAAELAPHRFPLEDLITGAGFELLERSGTGRRRRAPPTEEGGEEPGAEVVRVRLRRLRSLPDTVRPGMRVLVCGLNPSPAAADAGVGFFRPGNRFWPAALAAGLVSRDRDPIHALVAHGVGMTDLVKRTTPRAAELSTHEYSDGLARVERLCQVLAPRTVCVVGLAGWRAATDRRSIPGWQERTLGGRPVYVMPSTSGLNASCRLEELIGHLRVVAGDGGGRISG